MELICSKHRSSNCNSVKLMCAASYWPCKRLGLLRLLRGIAAFLGERKVKNAFLLLLLLLASALFPAENFSSSFKMQFYNVCDVF